MLNTKQQYLFSLTEFIIFYSNVCLLILCIVICDFGLYRKTRFKHGNCQNSLLEERSQYLAQVLTSRQCRLESTSRQLNVLTLQLAAHYYTIQKRRGKQRQEAKYLRNRGMLQLHWNDRKFLVALELHNIGPKIRTTRNGETLGVLQGLCSSPIGSEERRKVS